MIKIYKNARGMIAALAIAISAVAVAGNIPQYSFGNGTATYAEFSDGIAIPCSWIEGDYVIFPNQVETPNSKKAEGFPIGFDFKMGGRIFDQFVVSNVGVVHLGKGSVYVGPDGDAFTISMSPIMYGLKSAKISYKVTGTEGDRVLTVQYKNAVLREPSYYAGQYSLQIRLHEKDGKIELAFKEINTTSTQHMGFDVGLHGWDGKDAIQLTSKGLNNPPELSKFLKAYMLDNWSYILWDWFDYDNDYKPVFVFTPPVEQPAPVTPPTDLTLRQEETNLIINVNKAEEADATVVLVSDRPITEEDMPIDGFTFKAGEDAVFGNATAYYYGNEQNISLVVGGMVPDTKYYVKALSVNGYPSYGRDNAASAELTATQAAPSSLTTEAYDENTIKVTCVSDDKIIVAKSPVAKAGYMAGYIGTIGETTAEAQVGDVLPDGGEVVYVGESGSFKVACDPNTLTFLRAWSLREGQVSATSIHGHGVPEPSYPYEPRLESFPKGEQLQYWTADNDQFIPTLRSYRSDPAVVAVSNEDTQVSLVSPNLPLDSSVKLTFEYSLETVRDASATGESGVDLLQGSEPGKFGDTGYLRVCAGGEVYKTVNEYNGTMVSAGANDYEDGSSSFEEVSVDLPAIGYGEKITFEYSVPKSSRLFLRNIKIERTGEAPKAPESAPSAIEAVETRYGDIELSLTKGQDAEATLVLFSPVPFTDEDMPRNGRTPAVGSKIGNATVLYYGTDEQVECSTYISGAGREPIITDFDTDYYFRAFSANANPLFNTTEISECVYHTVPDMGYPSGVSLDVLGDTGLEASCVRHEGAEGTLLLIAEGEAVASRPEDGKLYAEGEMLGGGKVLYRGTDESVIAKAEGLTPGTQYTLTAYSYNRLGWYGDLSREAKAVTTDMKKPEELTLTVLSDTEMEAGATRSEQAEGTLLVLGSGTAVSERPQDGKLYAEGEMLGGGKVLYRGTDSAITVKATGLEPGGKYVLSGWSYDAQGKYGAESVSVEAQTTAIEAIEADADLSGSEVYTLQGLRLHVGKAAELPAGIYVIDGRKRLITK